MITDIALGQFFPGDSPIHRLDPRTKILWTILVMIGIFVIDTFAGFGALLLLTCLVIALTRIPARFYFRGLKPLVFLVIFTGIINLFFTSGNAVFTMPYVNWTITDAGIRLAILMILRLLLLITSTSVLTFTTSPIALTDGIEMLLRPFSKIGLPSHEIAMMMTIALRFIPTLLEEADKIIKAQTARGADFNDGNIIARAKAMVPILIPLFVSAFRRADELAVAMEARCYRGGTGRTRLHTLSFAKQDAVALVFGICFILLIVLCNFSPF